MLEPTSLLVALVGEQPIPALLAMRMLRPARAMLVVTPQTRAVGERLRDLTPGDVDLVEVAEPHRLDRVRERLEEGGTFPARTVVDLTGGTKPMALALATLAQSGAHDFPVRAVYLRTGRSEETLDVYEIADRASPLRGIGSENAPPLVTADEYVRAHVGDYVLTKDLPPWPSATKSAAEAQGARAGHAFEEAVRDALVGAGYDVLSSIRLPVAANLQEADLVVMSGNRAAVIEVSISGGKKPKQGLDQLVALAQRETLGTYVRRILVLAGRLVKDTPQLARAQRVEVIERLRGDYDDASGAWIWKPGVAEDLLRRMNEILGPPTTPQRPTFTALG